MREDLIERLRSVKWDVINDGDRMPDDPTRECVFVDMRPDDFEALLNEAADALEAAREDACFSLVADIRFACGDNGKRMQPELVEYIRELAEDAAKYRWALNNSRWIRGEHAAYVAIPVAREADLSCVAMRDAAIDQARGKGGAQ